MIDLEARYVTPEGVALAIAIVSPAFLLLSILAVAARLVERLIEGLLSIDDYLILGGTITYAADTSLAIYATTLGVGTPNARLNPTMQVEAMKYYTIWILLYVVGLAQLKSSICMMIWRVAAEVRRDVRAALCCLLALVWASFLVTFVGVLLYCSPVEASWDASILAEDPSARCGSVAAMIGMSHTATVTTLVTDVGCVALPGVLLWRTNMRRRQKLEVFALLSVASLASFSTIARAPFISRYEKPEDNLLYYVGYIVLFSNIETGIGCIAASLPSARRLYSRLSGSSRSPVLTSSARRGGKPIRTIGGGLVGSSSDRTDEGSCPPDEIEPSAADEAGIVSVWDQPYCSDSDERILLSLDSKPGLQEDKTGTKSIETIELGRI